jgi:RNA polymerase sigma factor (sigma-70 family)
MMDDRELLREYAEEQSEEAFRAIVERHAGMVQGVALRVAGPAAAEEVAQAVFTILARKAGGLGRKVVLAGWLHRTARFVALEAVRQEKRRRERNEAFSIMNNGEESEATWKQVAPFLESAIERLGASERSAVVLRFLEGRPFAEVAGALGISEAAAKMRVGRALDKLRAGLERDGVVTAASTLGTALSAHGACVAPTAFAQSLGSAALAMKTVESPLSVLVQGGLKAMAISKTKTAVLVVLPLLLLSGVILEVARPRPVMRTFEPMVGEWEGEIEMRADDGPGQKSPASLRIATEDLGRLCSIDMRIATGPGLPPQEFHFTHRVDETGRSITTTDDPKVALVDGPGKVITSADQNGTWKAGFRSRQRDGRGTSECVWTVTGKEMKIVRSDTFGSFLNKSERWSIVTLKRREDAAVN